jgi:hypothetical protein
MPAWGPGPAYPVIPASQSPARPIISFEFPPPAGLGDWGQQKVLWSIATAFRGRVVIRGRQLDGAGEVRFDRWNGGFDASRYPYPSASLHLSGSGGHPATTRVKTAGCYAYQVDGRGVSTIVVFQAVSSSG